MVASVLIGGCSNEKKPPQQQADASGPYVIGLGEIMGLTQMRHAKLWFAGQANNWPLAAYELDELKEGFDDAVRYHPHHKSVPRPLTTMIPQFVGEPIAEIDTAIKTRDRTRFVAAFDRLTAGCNACHEEASFGFNVVKRPTVPPYSNQSFTPAARSGA
ncbi:hypothetical protein ASD39_07940 [Sphingomonas sp. Root50]|nr:hypothetical protein ASD17_05185 [Sphingomonas sp. Root1294]KQY67836.1 hypothetical protein ASD39_07940 [Sphingomonas sp. Root50]KRB88760.1 hypothetical protein ASE22_20290 [Sphingomonas sp. Root720]